MKARGPDMTDPRSRFPEYLRLPRIKSWIEQDAKGSLILCEVREDPRTGRVLKGRFPV